MNMNEMAKKLTLTVLMLCVATSARAGKLSDGFRGRSWGQYESFDSPDPEHCVSSVVPKAAFLCEWSIDVGAKPIPVTVSYFYEKNMFVAVKLTASNFEHCKLLADFTLLQYGTPAESLKRHPQINNSKWVDGDAIAFYSYEPQSFSCEVYAQDNAWRKKLEDKRDQEELDKRGKSTTSF